MAANRARRNKAFAETSVDKQEARRRHLDAINAYLAERGLKPIPRTGDFSRGEWELVAPAQIDHTNPWYWIVAFNVIRPDGVHGQFFLRFQAQGAAGIPIIVIPMVNEKLVFVYQHRPAVSRWMPEFPRHFAKATLEPSILDRKVAKLAARNGLAERFPAHGLPLGLLGREATALMLGETLEVAELAQLSDGMPQDTGFDTSEPEVWFVRMNLADEAPLARLRGTKSEKIRFYSVDEVRRRRRELGITDALSMAALLLLFEHLGIV